MYESELLIEPVARSWDRHSLPVVGLRRNWSKNVPVELVRVGVPGHMQVETVDTAAVGRNIEAPSPRGRLSAR